MKALEQCNTRVGPAMAASYSNDVYYNKNKNLRIECIYFYYLTMRSDSHPNHVRAYFVDKKQYIPHDQMQDEIKDLVSQVRAKTLTPLARRLGGLDWCRKSYLAVIMDDAEQRLTKENAVMFANRSIGREHPFRDGRDIEPYDTITGFYCINHMTKPSGASDVYWSEDFDIEVCHNPLGCMPPNPLLLSHNDSGTNMGPPISPPA